MLDLLLVAAFIAVPLAIWLVTRSLTWTAVGLIFGFGVAGNAVQSSISLGMSWDTRGLQYLSVAVLIIVLILGLLSRRRLRIEGSSLRRQVVLIAAPIAVFGAFLILMRLMAPEHPGALTAVGYLVNHPLAEDNAKWLHLSSQLADGRDITFHGYAGGPLLMLMSMVAALISVLSRIFLGGVNQVAVAANTVIGVQCLLIALVPIALAPFAEYKALGRKLAAPTVWIAAFVLFIASAVVTSYGHLSLQFILIILTLWSTVFLMGVRGPARLLMTLSIVTAASVWIPFNVLGVLLISGCLVLALVKRNWIALAAVIVTGLAVWDALISSTLYLFGIQLGTPTGGADSVTDSSANLAPSTDVAQSLFTAPGGVETIAPLVGGLALVCVLFTVAIYSRENVAGKLTKFLPFFPIAALSIYLMLIQVSDAITTGSAPHYGGHKLTYAVVIMGLVSTLPVAISFLDSSASGMTMLRWFAIGGVIALLMFDTILPRAVSALSPSLWPAVNASEPQYWSGAEVRQIADQPISSLPVGCLVSPPESTIPTALPLGQASYSCTRLMLGLTGLEGEATPLSNWLMNDWLSNSNKWNDWHAALDEIPDAVKTRALLQMKADGQLAGFTTLDTLLARYPYVAEAQ